MSRYSGFRPEVQGLRAVAVLLVVVYHVFMGRVSGGVDIFLFISAFFMTLSFVRKIEGGRPLALGRYWLHTFKRLLPLATLVILGTFVLLWLFYPAQDAASFRSEGVASILYVENWSLAFNAVDYYAADHSSASPFQHFWSLSVQGQVFLVWPLIFAFAWWVKRCTGRSSVPVLAVCFGAVFVVSLTFSVITTNTQQAFAYFDTRARLWEFALGSLVALAIPYLRPSRGLRVLLGWAGFVSMVSVGILVDVQGAFPGWIALWPLLSAAAIIVAGQSGSRWGFDRFLSWGPVVRMGDSAYALYLVHWPLLITYLVIRDRPVAGPRSGVVIVVVSVLLALLLTRVVETPLKNWAWPEARNWRLGLVIVVCMSLVLAVAGSWAGVERQREARLEAQAELNNPGARALEPGFEYAGDPDAASLPLAQNITSDAASLGTECPADIELPGDTARFCHEAVANEEPAATVLVAGNSHVQHWLPAITALAEANDWRVLTYIQPGCFYTVASEQPGSQTCDSWFSGTQPMVDAVDPDLVFMQGTFTDVNQESWKPGMETRVRELVAQGIQVVGIRDVPRFEESLSDCALEHGEDAADCVTTHSMLGTPNPQEPLAQELEGFSTVDMTDVICPQGQCHPVVGNVFVYMDDDHITKTYSKSAAPQFSERVAEALLQDGYTGVREVE
ncbi:acyltransferase family protein [Kocuria sp. KSNUG]|uniref:acyltransferase family protein n=1 Tax=Kocuria sp. KSNUG TaxID=3136676 RepID=UPI003C2BC136